MRSENSGYSALSYLPHQKGEIRKELRWTSLLLLEYLARKISLGSYSIRRVWSLQLGIPE